jgi:hypothetical protein
MTKEKGELLSVRAKLESVKMRAEAELHELRSELEARTTNLSDVKSQLVEARASESHIREKVLGEAEERVRDVERAKDEVSSLQAHKLIQIYTNTDYCLVAFCTWIPSTSCKSYTRTRHGCGGSCTTK